MIYVATIQPSFEEERVVDASSDIDRLCGRISNDSTFGVLARVGIAELSLEYDEPARTWWQIGEDGTLRITEYDD